MKTHFVKLTTTPDLVDQVYRSLLDAINEGQLAPGTRITQEDIAIQLAVSRQPVLQAFRLLKRDGFVMDAPGRGVLITPLNVIQVGRLYQVRSALDALAVKLASERCCIIDPKLIVRGRKATQAKDLNEMIDADMAFHLAIYQASNNPLIAESAHLHWNHLRRVMGAVLHSSKHAKSVWDEHEALSKAISDGNTEKAVNLSCRHVDKASISLTTRLSDQLNKQPQKTQEEL